MRFIKVAAICALLSVSVNAQTGGLLGLLPGLGQLPIVSPLLANLPILGNLLGGLLSTDLLELLSSGEDRPVRAIVRGDVAAIQTAALRDGLPVVKVLDGFVVVYAAPSALKALLSVSGVEAISLDRLVGPTMSISDKAMAADQARAATGGLLLGLLGDPAVSGKGVGVAVVDSGIASHVRLTGKVKVSVNFAGGESDAGDAFGHGTHIAGIIAGAASSTNPTSLYKSGIAPGAHLINVRVLGRSGMGYSSDVIAGIQWVVANRTKYSIRVMNLSLGHPVVAPCALDPLCLAAERAVAAGLVVVASAGNSGKDAEGRPVLGSISTPGNGPSVLTVGAINTWNTVSRADDTVTTYSSRGPTRYDMGVKPDVVAPGNKIVSLAAAGSYLASTYSDLHVAGSGTNAYMRMSGTSMAAAMVSGGAALLLESEPTLTARQLKVTLQMTASAMHREGLMASGTGSVNLHAARKMGSLSLSTLLGTLPTTTIGGRVVYSSGLAYLHTGAKLDQTAGYAGLRAFGLLDARRSLLGWGLPARTAGTGAAQILWGDINMWTADQQILWGDQMLNPGGQQILWGDHVFNPAGQQILWGDHLYGPSGQQILWGDQTPYGQQILWGDQTTGGEQILWGDQTAAGQQILWGDSIRGDGQ
jgi:serine protease AprX